MMGGPSVGADAPGALVEVLAALLPADTRLALAWRDAGAGGPAMGLGPQPLLERAKRRATGDAGDDGAAAALDILWSDGGARIAVAPDPAAPLDPQAAARWHRLAPLAIRNFVRAENAASQVRALRKSERLLQALYEKIGRASCKGKSGGAGGVGVR